MSEGPSETQQKLYDLAEQVQEQLQVLLGKAKEVEAIKNALEKIDELLAQADPYKKSVNEAMDQLRKVLQDVMNSSIGKQLGLSAQAVEDIEE